MLTLLEKQLNFNPKITMNNTGGNLSTDTGLVLVKEFMTKIDFTRQAQQLLHFEDQRKYIHHDNISLLEQLLLQIIAGYSADSSANFLQKDPIFQLILEKEATASPASLSRFWKRISQTTLSDFQKLNQTLIDQARLNRHLTELIIDLDSTHSDTFGHQEAANYNGHYGTMGYHPLVAFDGLTGDFLKAELRSGSVYTSNGVRQFLAPLLEHYNQLVPNTYILVRGDSGFATPELYELCETSHAYYVVRLKANRNLGQLAEEFIRIDDDHAWERREVHYYSTMYQAKSWSRERRVCIKSTREAGELLFRHEFVLTNLTHNISAKQVFNIYQKRGAMENFIKEAKNGFYFDKTDSSSFTENYARMMVSVLAYNLVNFMKNTCLPEKERTCLVDTLRLKLFKVAGKVTHSARRWLVKTSTSHVYQDMFYKLSEKIHQLCW
ncbi:IS1380 family transposase [Vagococcus elongatus]|uniref:IS1380 family transposase n=1 Tax=Vagococcus elongatus TaxID=180344 RepID=A0A430AG16_9ENTE|nr:IS1380 family transposase [Vagococcus elongatus]RSU06828.1 IS1380 family transposase [Vagococcus elongatus]